MSDYQAAKALVKDMHAAVDRDPARLTEFTAKGYHWRGMHPWHEMDDAAQVATEFWAPIHTALGPVQRRPDIFFAGLNQVTDYTGTWVVEMGHLAGTWDAPWLGIPPSRRLAFLRYCEFHRVEDGKIAESAVYVDIVNLLAQDGRSPLPNAPGLVTLTPGPITHDGLLHSAQPEAEGRTTVELIVAMVDDLRAGGVTSPDDHLERFWTPDMNWFGPGGIGASMTYAGYNRGHTHPFEEGLVFDRFTEHKARLGEGMYGGFFGYPSLHIRNNGYLGMPATDVVSEMRIVDLYRRDGDKLAENWIFIDMPHFFAAQGIDLIGRAAG
ncbi:MAG: ester cyclase [Shimia sp.]